MGVVRITRTVVSWAVFAIVAVPLFGTVLFAITVPVAAAVSTLGSDALLVWVAGCYVTAAVILAWWAWSGSQPARASRSIRRLRPSRRFIGVLVAGRRRIRRKPVITLECWSQPWPCPHRYGFQLSCSPFRRPSAEVVQRGATCRCCGAHLFEDGRIPVPAHFRPEAERDAEQS